MPRLSPIRPPQSEEPRSRTKELEGRGAARPEHAVRAPRDDHRPRSRRGVTKIRVVRKSDRVARSSQLARIGGAQREEVDDLKTTVAPSASEADAAPDRRIVGGLVGGGGIQHAERDDRS
jgi:hypothetical protein